MILISPVYKFGSFICIFFDPGKTLINVSGADLFATSIANRVNSIDVINKDVDPLRQDQFEMAQMINVTEFDNLTVKLQATYIDQEYYHLDDNDHGNATDPLNGLVPGPLVIPTLRTFCLGTLTNVTTDRAFECSNASSYTEQYEINVVSDFDGPHNFTVGLYDYQSEAYNTYTIQTTAYLLMNDFDQHPYAALFSNQLNNHAGTLFYSVLAGTLASQRANLLAAAANGTAALAAAATALVPTIRNTCAGASAQNTGFNGTCIKDMPAEAGGLINDQRTANNSTAVYGEYYFTPLDNLKITLGGRYMDDRFITKSRKILYRSGKNFT